MIDARFVPLEKWPGEPTAPENRKSKHTFRATYGKTLDLLEYELASLVAQDIIIQAEFKREDIRNDGWPRSSAKPAGPAVIVSFESRVGPMSFACDTYEHHEANLRAIALTLEALRAVDRYGATKTGEQYRGFAALPPGASEEFSQRDAAALYLSEICVLPPGQILSAGSELRTKLRREAAKLHHPDKGGDPAVMDKINRAFDRLEKP